ncbi:nucleotidyltransferase domain-containing protein [Mycobacterium hubeiense]|uniref:nucleotidyltransferase family protein n=1 Tax=Mycobacterium hubeiense TaxID=1867256 RepID=UPI0018ECF511
MLKRLEAAAEPRPSALLAERKRAIKRLASQHKARDIKVFGSVVRGDDRPGSDLDLLVQFAPDASLFDQVELAQGIEDLLGVHVEVVSVGGLRPDHAEIRAQARPL